MATLELAKLASAIERQAVADGGCDTAAPALRLSRFAAPSDHENRSIGKGRLCGSGAA
jgi:hypothetical protein